MKTLLLAISMALAGLTLTVAPVDADAKRLGGGRAVGVQRQAPAKPADATPNTPAQPGNAATAAPAAAPGQQAPPLRQASAPGLGRLPASQPAWGWPR